MGSSRLPNKVLLKYKNLSILDILINRLKNTRLIDKIIIATTNKKKDIKIVNYCKKNNIKYFRGSETDVLSRYYLAAKKYKIQKNIRPKTKSIVSEFNENKKIKKTWTPVLINNSIFDDNSESSTQQYRMIKKNRKRQEVFSVALNRRLLRTKKTLVVPAHVNITAITNSYDVVHSWFIPGLGLKIDCIPGRSTHHTFFVDNVGFYYGQCAEICGRYHHHMPVRLCALPFEHFLVWWNTFGLPKLLFTNNQKRFSNYYSFRKYVW